MKISRILTMLCCMLFMSVVISGCGGAKKEAKQQISVGNVDVEIISCSFDKQVMGVDEEYTTWGYLERAGKVYVNLALKVENNGEDSIGKEDFTGYFEYNSERYDLQYDLASVAPTPNNDAVILPGNIGVVHMLTYVEDAVMENEIVVKYSILGEEFEEKVAPIDTRDAFSKKTEVSKGEIIDANGLYTIEVIECTEKEYLQATNHEEAEQYYAMNKQEKFIDLVLKVKNNTDVDLESITGYIIINDEIQKMTERIEVNNNTEFEYLDMEPLKAGQEEYIHILASVDKDVSAEGVAVRFNMVGNCYYCYVE